MSEQRRRPRNLGEATARQWAGARVGKGLRKAAPYVLVGAFALGGLVEAAKKTVSAPLDWANTAITRDVTIRGQTFTVGVGDRAKIDEGLLAHKGMLPEDREILGAFIIGRNVGEIPGEVQPEPDATPITVFEAPATPSPAS